ncbi:unnamed protein product [Amoebophrya sp. A25]|nr:unnamed protein product [Amoebophrya sp. A25]|eukprot:GSA25T00012769001.1
MSPVPKVARFPAFLASLFLVSVQGLAPSSAVLGGIHNRKWIIRGGSHETGDVCIPRGRNALTNTSNWQPVHGSADWVVSNERNPLIAQFAWPICCLDMQTLVRFYTRAHIRDACADMPTFCCDRHRWREELVQSALTCENPLLIKDKDFWLLWKTQVIFATPTSQSVGSKVFLHHERQKCMMGELIAAMTTCSVLQMAVGNYKFKAPLPYLDKYYEDMRFYIGSSQVLFAAIWRSRSLTLYDLILGGQWQLFSILDAMANTWNDAIFNVGEPTGYGWGPYGSLRPSEIKAIEMREAKRLGEGRDDSAASLNLKHVEPSSSANGDALMPKENDAALKRKLDQKIIEVDLQQEGSGTTTVDLLSTAEQDAEAKRLSDITRVATYSQQACKKCRISQWATPEQKRRDKEMGLHILRMLKLNRRISFDVLLKYGDRGETCEMGSNTTTTWVWKEWTPNQAEILGDEQQSQFLSEAAELASSKFRIVGGKKQFVKVYMPASQPDKITCLRLATLRLALAYSLIAHDVPAVLPVKPDLGHQMQNDARTYIQVASTYLELAMQASANPMQELLLFGNVHEDKPFPTFPVLGLLTALSIAANSLYLARGMGSLWTIPFYDSIANNVRVGGGQRPFCTDGLFLSFVDHMPFDLESRDDADVQNSLQAQGQGGESSSTSSTISIKGDNGEDINDNSSSSPAALFVEVGSHQGDCLLHALRKFSHVHAVAFEPNQLAVDAFERTVRANKWESRVRIVKGIIVKEKERAFTTTSSDTTSEEDDDEQKTDVTNSSTSSFDLPPTTTSTAQTLDTKGGTIQKAEVDVAVGNAIKNRNTNKHNLHTVFLNPHASAQSFVTQDSFFGTKKKSKIADASMCLLNPEFEQCQEYDLVPATTLDEHFRHPMASNFFLQQQEILYLKVHCQGCELAAMVSAKTLFRQERICVATAKIETIFEGLIDAMKTGSTEVTTTTRPPTRLVASLRDEGKKEQAKVVVETASVQQDETTSSTSTAPEDSLPAPEADPSSSSPSSPDKQTKRGRTATWLMSADASTTDPDPVALAAAEALWSLKYRISIVFAPQGDVFQSMYRKMDSEIDEKKGRITFGCKDRKHRVADDPPSSTSGEQSASSTASRRSSKNHAQGMLTECSEDSEKRRLAWQLQKRSINFAGDIQLEGESILLLSKQKPDSKKCRKVHDFFL